MELKFSVTGGKTDGTEPDHPSSDGSHPISDCTRVLEDGQTKGAIEPSSDYAENNEQRGLKQSLVEGRPLPCSLKHSEELNLPCHDYPLSVDLTWGILA